MEIAKGGLRFDRARYQLAVARFALALIADRRTLFAPTDDMLRGSRFNSDDDVLARVESSYTEEEFMACPGLAVDAMLGDAASADHWYAFEKDYGMEIADEEAEYGPEEAGDE